MCVLKSRLLAWIVMGLMFGVVSGCQSPDKPKQDVSPAALCSPGWCDGGCGDDGCGGSCACQTGSVCNAQTQCVAPSACTNTCQSEGYQCGTVCGVSCGTCTDQQECVWHKCYAKRTEQSCPDCVLKLSLVREPDFKDNGNIAKVVLAIDYNPSSTEARMADMWIYANADVKLARVETGEGLADAGKAFFIDPVNHVPYRQRADRAFSLLALSLTNRNAIGAGRLATLEFTLDHPKAVAFKLVHHPTLAPAGADNELASMPYDSAVVVSPK